MKRAALVGVLAALLAVSALPMPIAAQENATNATDRPEVQQWVDEEIGITGWEYRDGSFVLTLRHTGERPRTVTMVESVQRREGMGDISVAQRRVLPGENTLTIVIPRRNGEAGMSITTGEGLNQGRGAFVSTGQKSGNNNPFGVFGGTQGLFVGILLSLGMALAAVWVTLYKENDGVQVAS